MQQGGTPPPPAPVGRVSDPAALSLSPTAPPTAFVTDEYPLCSGPFCKPPPTACLYRFCLVALHPFCWGGLGGGSGESAGPCMRLATVDVALRCALYARMRIWETALSRALFHRRRFGSCINDGPRAEVPIRKNDERPSRNGGVQCVENRQSAKRMVSNRCGTG